MARNRIVIKNRHLAFGESLKFISFLRKKYPTTTATITFQYDPIFSIKVEGCEYIAHFRGVCRGTEVRVSTFETDVEEQLRLIAHEYRHAMQTNSGLYPDSEAHVFTFQGRTLKCHGAAEQDAVKFSAYAVQEFLETREKL